MTFSPEFLLGLILALIGGIAWAVRLEGKINRANERHTEFREESRERFRRHEQDFREWRGGPIKIDRPPAREGR